MSQPNAHRSKGETRGVGLRIDLAAMKPTHEGLGLMRSKGRT